MRLTAAERAHILSAVHSLDPKARVFLYGSRVNPVLKGGDIDLLVISNKMGFSEKISLLVELKKRLGDQKIDLIVKSESAAGEDAFVRSIRSHAVEIA